MNQYERNGFVIYHERAALETVWPFFICTRMNKEETLHAGVAKYLRLQYPWALFNSDMSGVRLHRGLQAKVARLRSSRGMPDIMIFEPREQWYGLFIELKATDTRLLLKDGTLTKNAHIQEQASLMRQLRDRGYLATFARGFGETRVLIDWYLKRECSPFPLPNYLP